MCALRQTIRAYRLCLAAVRLLTILCQHTVQNFQHFSMYLHRWTPVMLPAIASVFQKPLHSHFPSPPFLFFDSATSGVFSKYYAYEQGSVFPFYTYNCVQLYPQCMCVIRPSMGVAQLLSILVSAPLHSHYRSSNLTIITTRLQNGCLSRLLIVSKLHVSAWVQILCVGESIKEESTILLKHVSRI